jgi:large subunit ribosomal protein L29
MTRAAEIRTWGDQELADRLTETKAELFNLRFQVVTGQLDTYSRIDQVKKDIARMRTEVRARQLGMAEQTQE